MIRPFLRPSLATALLVIAPQAVRAQGVAPVPPETSPTTVASASLAPAVVPPSTPNPDPTATWKPGMYPPPGYHTRRVVNPLVVRGAILLGASYVAGAGLGSLLRDRANANWATLMYVPGAGPLYTAVMGAAHVQSDGEFQAIYDLFFVGGEWVLILVGVAQIEGLALLAQGLNNPKTLLRPDIPTVRELQLTPLGGSGWMGIGVSGKF